MSAETTMITGKNYDKKIKNIGSLIIAACANENKKLNVNPEDLFREKRLETIEGKVRLLLFSHSSKKFL